MHNAQKQWYDQTIESWFKLINVVCRLSAVSLLRVDDEHMKQSLWVVHKCSHLNVS